MTGIGSSCRTLLIWSADILTDSTCDPPRPYWIPSVGPGTTTVECKKLGIGSIGIEPNPMAYFASSVKVDWRVCHEALLDYAERGCAVHEEDAGRTGIG